MKNAKPREQLVSELIDSITSAVNLHHLDKSKLDANTALTGKDGLGLDSVDILEAVVVVEHGYGIKVESAEMGKKVFQTFGTIADYILAR